MALLKSEINPEKIEIILDKSGGCPTRGDIAPHVNADYLFNKDLIFVLIPAIRCPIHVYYDPKSNSDLIRIKTSNTKDIPELPDKETIIEHLLTYGFTEVITNLHYDEELNLNFVGHGQPLTDQDKVTYCVNLDLMELCQEITIDNFKELQDKYGGDSNTLSISEIYLADQTQQIHVPYSVSFDNVMIPHFLRWFEEQYGEILDVDSDDEPIKGDLTSFLIKWFFLHILKAKYKANSGFYNKLKFKKDVYTESPFVKIGNGTLKDFLALPAVYKLFKDHWESPVSPTKEESDDDIINVNEGLGYSDKVVTHPIPDACNEFLDVSWTTFLHSFENFKMGCLVHFLQDEVISDPLGKVAWICDDIAALKYFGENHPIEDKRNHVEIYTRKDGIEPGDLKRAIQFFEPIGLKVGNVRRIKSAT